MGNGIKMGGGGGIKVLVEGEKMKAKELALEVDFDMKTERPVTMTQPPQADDGIYATFKNKLYKIGGILDQFNKDVYETKDLVTWTKIKNLPFSANQNFIGFEFDNKFHIVGIYAYGGQAHWVTNDFETWTKLKDIPFKIENGLGYLFEHKGVLHFFNSEYHDIGRHYISTDGENFAEDTRLPIVRGGYLVTSNDTDLILLSKNKQMRNSIDGGKTWNDLPNTPFVVVSNITASIYSNKTIYVLGVSGQQNEMWQMNNDYSWNKKSNTFSNANVIYNTVVFNDYICTLSKATYKYQPTLDQWTDKVGGLPFDFYNGSAVLDGKFPRILGGGGTPRGNAHYDGKEWFVDEPLPIDLTVNHAIYLDGKTHIFKSSYSYSLKNYIEHYVKSNGVWTKKNDAISNIPSLNGFTPLILKGKIHLMTWYSKVEDQRHLIYDTNTDTWSTLTPAGIVDDSSVQNEDYTFVVNKDIISTNYHIGENNNNIYWHEYNDISDTWVVKQIENSALYFSDKKGWSLVSFKNNVYMIGNGNVSYSQGMVYKLTDNTNVEQMPNTPNSVSDWSALVPTNNQLFILGSRVSNYYKSFSQTQFSLDHLLY